MPRALLWFCWETACACMHVRALWHTFNIARKLTIPSEPSFLAGAEPQGQLKWHFRAFSALPWTYTQPYASIHDLLNSNIYQNLTKIPKDTKFPRFPFKLFFLNFISFIHLFIIFPFKLFDKCLPQLLFTVPSNCDAKKLPLIVFAKWYQEKAFTLSQFSVQWGLSVNYHFGHIMIILSEYIVEEDPTLFCFS